MNKLYVLIQTIERDSYCEVYESETDARVAMTVAIADYVGFPNGMDHKSCKEAPDIAQKLFDWLMDQFESGELDGELSPDSAWLNDRDNCDWSIQVRTPKPEGNRNFVHDSQEDA